MRACEIAGVEPRFVDVAPADPIAYVLSLNLHRRHLTPSQAGMIGGRAREVYDQQAKERQKAAVAKGNKTRHGQETPVPQNSAELAPNGDARAQVGKAVGS